MRTLLQGRVLSIEDLVDVISLKDNVDNLANYGLAVSLIARDHVSVFTTKFCLSWLILP